MPRTPLLWLLLVLGLLSGLPGCSEDAHGPSDIKKIDELISEKEFESFQSILDSLPDKRLPPLQPVFLPPPNWSSSRSLPVSELVQGERKLLEEHASVEFLARHITPSKAFERALRREKMTVQQFIGLALVLGFAQSRNELPDSEDTDKILARGSQVLVALDKDKRVFNTLSEDDVYYVLEQAAWVPLVDRLKRLKKIPDQNRELARRHQEVLKHALPEEFRMNPLQGLSKLLEEESLPFNDPGGINPDDHIAWNPDTALVGKDAIELKPTHDTTGLQTIPASAHPE